MNEGQKLSDEQFSDKIQDTFASELSDYTDFGTAEHFVDRLLNGFWPALFYVLTNTSTRYVLSCCFKEQNCMLRLNPQAPTLVPTKYVVELCLEKETKTLKLAHVRYQFGDSDLISVTPNDPAEKLQLAMRVVLSTYMNVQAQVRGHVASAHFNMEQYAIAFFRNLRSSPIRQLIFPHIKETPNINSQGRNILLNASTGAIPKTLPFTPRVYLHVDSICDW